MALLQNRSAINNMLMSHGLGRLEDGAGLVSQLGFLVQDDEHFRQLLMKAEPSERRAMYDSMKLYLRFTPRPFDDYLIETNRLAEVKQLPVMNADGTLRPYSPPEAMTQAAVIIENAIADSLAKGWLELTCKKCTKVESFGGANKSDAIRAAREAGWTYQEINGDGREICPECP